MGRKFKLIPFLFKPMEPSSTWPWPAGGSPRTFSFRPEKTMNPVYIPENESRITETSESESVGGSIVSITTELEDVESGGGESVENVIRGLTGSRRLFFEPGDTTSSILKAELQQATAAAVTNVVTTEDGLIDMPSKENSFVVMEMESRDPFIDFKKSMEEMMDADGLKCIKDWDRLEELLNWYLRVNEKSNHGYIVGAFVDLLVTLHFPTFISSPPSAAASCDDTFTITQSPISAFSISSSSSTSTFTSNCTTAHCLASLEEEDEARDDYNEEIVLGNDHEASSSTNV